MTLKAQQAVLILKNDRAPYSGILMPSSYVKDLEQKAALAKMYKDTLDKNSDCLPELSSFEPPPAGSGFWEGAVVGVLSSVLVFVIIRH